MVEPPRKTPKKHKIVNISQHIMRPLALLPPVDRKLNPNSATDTISSISVYVHETVIADIVPMEYMAIKSANIPILEIDVFPSDILITTSLSRNSISPLGTSV